MNNTLNKNRLQVISASIMMIFLICILLIGVTYAYYTTTVRGNTSDISVQGKFGSLDLIYEDGNGTLKASSVKKGDIIGEKTFKVINKSKSNQEYGVILDNISNTFTSEEAIHYNINCSSSNSSCTGISDEKFYFPKKTDEQAQYMFAATIAPSETQNYTMKIYYSSVATIEYGSKFSAKINITESPMKKGLAEKVISSAKSQGSNSNGYAVYVENSYIGSNLSANEHSLSLTKDSYGNSYYFRGSVQNNYVIFNSMCWRIVRIQGDGSIKLILEDSTKNSSCKNASKNPFISSSSTAIYGYSNTNNSNLGTSKNPYRSNYKSGQSNSMRTTLNNWIKNNFSASLLIRLKQEDWCVNYTGLWYNSSGISVYESSIGSTYVTTLQAAYFDDVIGKPSNFYPLRCNSGEKSHDYAGLLTASEAFAAGIGSRYSWSYSNNKDCYLSNPFPTNSNGGSWFLATPYGRNNLTDTIYTLPSYTSSFYINHSSTATSTKIRPVIVLASGTSYSTGGTGTKDNPYKVS